MNDIQNVTKQTPIEIALGIDEDGKTTASKLYDFLELNPNNYARWCKTNIIENKFAEENVDYVPLLENSSSMKSLSDKPTTGRGNTQDFKLSANFAKKLSMQGKTEKAEQARNYFIAVEGKLKEIATKGMSHNTSRLTITSRELIKIAGLRNNIHHLILKNIRECIEELRKTNFIAEDFFIESEYVGANNQMHTQFLCTEQGCIYYTSYIDMDMRDTYREEVHFRFLQL